MVEPDGRPDALLAVLLTTALRSRSAASERDCAQAIHDLATAAHFAPVGFGGPFRLRLGVDAGRLVFDVRDRDDRTLHVWHLSLGPFRRLLKDYAVIVDSYEEASRFGGAARLQAIDMARRGVHDEAATVLADRLRGRIDVDHDTARRLFTLLVLLTQRAG